MQRQQTQWLQRNSDQKFRKTSLDDISAPDLREDLKDAILYLKMYFPQPTMDVTNLLLLGGRECGKSIIVKQLILSQPAGTLDAYANSRGNSRIRDRAQSPHNSAPCS
ncbi:hypothetical protein VNI00_015026 [Paramarasmius palmivorus]|uniref:Uncharacterized protein n=1 Tax=Paramarasmius palmivorus TaxID=297713 RepID=A0AAW0BPD0_9AGAR